MAEVVPLAETEVETIPTEGRIFINKLRKIFKIILIKIMYNHFLFVVLIF